MGFRSLLIPKRIRADVPPNEKYPAFSDVYGYYWYVAPSLVYRRASSVPLLCIPRRFTLSGYRRRCPSLRSPYRVIRTGRRLMDLQTFAAALIIVLLSIIFVGIVVFYNIWEKWEKSDKLHYRVVTCPQGVVAFTHHAETLWKWYRAIDHMNWATGKIRDVLEANPNCDLKALEKSFDITITNIQLNPHPNSTISEQGAVQARPTEPHRRPGFLGSDNQ